MLRSDGVYVHPVNRAMSGLPRELPMLSTLLPAKKLEINRINAEVNASGLETVTDLFLN